MLDLVPTLIPLLMVDVLNPVLFALLLVAVGNQRPIATSAALVAGHTSAYFLSGVIIALALEQIAERLNNPLPIDYMIGLVIGLACLWAALASRGGAASEEKTPRKELTPLYGFGYGAVVNFVGVPFALPYFAAVDQVLKAELTVESSLLVLALYNALYALPFALIPVVAVLMGERSRPALESINRFLSRAVDMLMPFLLLGLGLALGADAIAYFGWGSGLW